MIKSHTGRKKRGYLNLHFSKLICVSKNPFVTHYLGRSSSLHRSCSQY